MKTLKWLLILLILPISPATRAAESICVWEIDTAWEFVLCDAGVGADTLGIEARVDTIPHWILLYNLSEIIPIISDRDGGRFPNYKPRVAVDSLWPRRVDTVRIVDTVCDPRCDFSSHTWTEWDTVVIHDTVWMCPCCGKERKKR